MKRVTEPSLLEALNSGGHSKVADQSILNQLNNTEEESSEEGWKPNLKEMLGRYLVKDPIVGLANLGHGVINAPHNIAALFSEDLASHIPKQEEHDYARTLGLPEDRNLIDSLIQIAPELAGSFAVPAARLGKIGAAVEAIPKGGKYLKTALENALSQGAYASALAPENQREAGAIAAGIAGPFSGLSQAASEANPLLRNIARIGIGGGGGLIGYQAAKAAEVPEYPSELFGALTGYLSSKGVGAKFQAGEKIAEGIQGSPYKENLKAARELGLSHITPAEASENPYLGQLQGALGKTKEGGKLLYQKGQERLESEKGAIKNFLDTAYNPKESTSQKNELYEQAKKIQVPEERLQSLKQNEIFKRAETIVKGKSAYKESLKGVPENSVEYLDHIKSALDDMIEKKPRKEGRIIVKTKNNLLNVIDELSPEYKQARSLAERQINRSAVESFFNKKEMTGSTFSQFLKDENKYNKLYHSLREVPSAQRQLSNMKKVFPKLINVPTAKTAEALSRSGMNKFRESFDALKNSLDEMARGGRNDRLAVELITNPKWEEEISKLAQTTKTEKIASALSALVSKAGAQIAAQQD